jgi:CDP-diacylglycerol pyrophosphatase
MAGRRALAALAALAAAGLAVAAAAATTEDTQLVRQIVVHRCLCAYRSRAATVAA